MASREEGESPTSSQLARKRLGFENLFDQTDPDVQEIDDVVDMGLLSGRYVRIQQLHFLSLQQSLLYTQTLVGSPLKSQQKWRW